MITPLIFPQNYIKEIAITNIDYIQSTHFLSLYNQIVVYLNNNIIPAINSIEDKAFGGVSYKPNTFLINHGATTATEWVTLATAIRDNTIQANNLVPDAIEDTGKFGILMSNEAGIRDFVNLADRLDNEEYILASNDVFDGEDTSYRFMAKKVNISNIADQTLTGEKFALNSLPNSVLKSNARITTVAESSVTNDNFTANSIYNNKIVDGTVNISKLGTLNLTMPNRFMLKIGDIKYGSIDISKLFRTNNAAPVIQPKHFTSATPIGYEQLYGNQYTSHDGYLDGRLDGALLQNRHNSWK